MFIFAAAHIDIHTLQLSSHNPVPAVQHSDRLIKGAHFRKIRARARKWR